MSYGVRGGRRTALGRGFGLFVGTLLASACAGAPETGGAGATSSAAPSPSEGEVVVGAPRPLSGYSASYSASSGSLVLTRSAAPSVGALRPQAFGERPSDQGEGTEELSVTSDAFRRDEECPSPAPNQLCVQVTIQNNRPYLVRNVYLQITSLTPNDPARFGGKNSDGALPEHARAFRGAPGASLGLWWFGHLPPRGSKRVQVVFNNPQEDFNFQAQTWGDPVTTCTRFGRDEWPNAPRNDSEAERVRLDSNCDGVNGGVGSGVFVDAVRGSDTPCPTNPVPGEYPNDDSQGVTGCGNGTLRRPYASISTALARRNGRPDIYIAGARGGITYNEPATLVVPDGVILYGGYNQTDGFVSRFDDYRTTLVVPTAPEVQLAGPGADTQLLTLRTAR